MDGRFKVRFEKRLELSRSWQVLSTLLGLVVAFLVSAILIASAQADILVAFTSLFNGAFGNGRTVAETLVQATPLIFTGLAIVIAFRARIWNIGAEGQLFAGAAAATWVGQQGGDLPPVVLIVLIILAAMLGGAFWGAIPGFLKAKLGVDEILVTIMMNFIMLFLLAFLISGPWRDPSSFYQQTATISETAQLPVIYSQSRLHIGFVIALLAAGSVYLLLWKTPLGYEIRAMGINSTAARHKGVDIAKTIIIIMVFSGALAGLAGGIEVAGLHHRLRLDISTGFGFTGIIIALLGRLHPVGVIITAILFGALINGALAMQIDTGVPIAIVSAIQGIILLALLMAEVLSRYRIRRGIHVE